MKLAIVVLALTLCGVSVGDSILDLNAQSPTSLSFEVSVVKINRSGAGASFSGCYKPGSTTIPKGRCVFQNVTARTLVASAYDIDFEWAADYISGGPSWFTSDRYDVEAKAEDPDASSDQLRSMLQTLLFDRFHLALRETTKQVSGYALVIAKDGPKLTPSAPNTRPGMINTVRPDILWSGQNQTVETIARFLAQGLRVPVQDRTKLTGHYDFKLSWHEDETTDPRERLRAFFGPHLFTALQEQLGLKLESEKIPAKFLAIDSIEKPTEN